MPALAEASDRRSVYGPAPAGFFLTPKLLEEVPSLRESELHQQISALLVTAESELFDPLLAAPRMTDFTQNFEMLARKYFPIRLQMLVLILNAVGAERFRVEYFEWAPTVAATLATVAQDWGLDPSEVAGAFEQYFGCARKILTVARHLPFALPTHVFPLMNALTEIDYGFTAMAFVFEGSITTQPWCVGELFRLTRRSLSEYERTTEAMVAYLKQTKPGQAELFAERSVAQVKVAPTNVVSLRKRSLGEAGRRLRSMTSVVAWPDDDQDSDYE